MKWKNAIFILFIICLIIYNGGINAFAMNTGFSTSEMNVKEQSVFLSNINLSPIYDEPPKSAITCFDVSKNGLIAIGFTSSENKYISVYDTTGKFQYGYTFNCNQSFGVQWDNADLIIYFVRSDVAASFSSDGTNIELKKIEDTADNNSYWNHFVFSKEKTIDGNKYTIKNNMGPLNIFASSYSQLLRTAPDGNETIVYDASATQATKTIFIFIAVLLFIVLVTAVIIWQFFRVKRK